MALVNDLFMLLAVVVGVVIAIMAVSIGICILVTGWSCLIFEKRGAFKFVIVSIAMLFLFKHWFM